MTTDFDSLPFLKSFNELKRGHKVYSKKHGIGTVSSLYQGDQIIVQFSNVRLRFSALDEEIARIPHECLKKPKMKTEVYLDSQKVSFKEYKKRKKLDEIRKSNQKILDEINEANAKCSNHESGEQLKLAFKKG